jgi:dolichol kinase
LTLAFIVPLTVQVMVCVVFLPYLAPAAGAVTLIDGLEIVK